VGRDGIIAIGVLAVCAILWAQLGSVPANPLTPIGPTFYPKILLTITALLALALLVQALRAGPRSAALDASPGGTQGWASYRPAVVTFGGSVLYALLLPGIGYLAATTLYVAGLAWGLGPATPRRVPGSVALGVLTAAGTYWIFQWYLHVFLPNARWFR
jgi:putative tricarboxylic transport membrane protein